MLLLNTSQLIEEYNHKSFKHINVFHKQTPEFLSEDVSIEAILLIQTL